MNELSSRPLRIFYQDTPHKDRLLLMLLLIATYRKPRHGYKLIQRIKTRSDVNLSSGSIYPYLNFLEKKGYIEGIWERSGVRQKRIYSCLEKGRKVVEDFRLTYDNLWKSEPE